MKITGVTIIKNAVLNDYPVKESILSILPLVDEMIVSVGDSDDETEALIRSIQSEKIRIVHSVWDKSIRKGGSVLAIETNKALKHVGSDTDWIFYIQADEVIHEKYHSVIRTAAEKYCNDTEVDGLLFHYLHFYGTYDYVRDGRGWYPEETRIIRNKKSIVSYRDAQGFRIDKKKIKVARIDAFVFHYGWVKEPKKMKTKQKNVAAFWTSDDNKLQQFQDSDDFFNFNNYDSISYYKGDHPAVMKNRILQKNWQIQLDVRKKKIKLKYKLLAFIENLIGRRLFVFSNHKIIR